MPSVRIGIDARKLHDFGIGTYIRNLLRQLARLDRQTEFVVLCRPEDRETLSSLGENFRVVTETSGNYSVAEQLKIPIALRREGVTLFHAPHYVLPPLVHCRSVVTIHDCIHLMFPQYLPNRVALAYARTSIRLAARRATRVLTVSESSKRDILRFVDEISKYAALRRAVHHHQLHEYVRFLGYLPEETLAVMYRLAAVFVFPSLYEGFGLPPLEAMASGTPVVTSNLSSLPEVAGDAAVLVDPYDPHAIAEGIHRVLTDETLRRTLRLKGVARAGQFSWEQSVRRIRQIYREADGSPVTAR